MQKFNYENYDNIPSDIVNAVTEIATVDKISDIDLDDINGFLNGNQDLNGYGCTLVTEH